MGVKVEKRFWTFKVDQRPLYTAPDDTSSNPSRTTVDLDGSVWVANRGTNPGSVTHIGLDENGQCEDRNGDGVQTSTKLGDILQWSSGDGGERGVANAQDECIVHYTIVR